MSIATYSKDPAAKANFSIDYSDWLAGLGAGLTIADSDWTLPTGITQDQATFTTTTTTIRLSGGTDGQDYEILNHVALSDGQEDEKALTIQVRHAEAGSSQDATDRSNALALLLRWVKRDVAPPLDQTDIEAILDSHKAASTWTPNTFYETGRRLLPPVRNGWWYEVIQPGTSQSDARAFNEWPSSYGARLVDGTSDPQLILEAAGEDVIFRAEHADPSSINCYDVRGAARECVQTRLQLASHFVSDGDVAFDQITTHLEGLLKRFYPIRFPMKVMRA